jgi:hypothetical protein
MDDWFPGLLGRTQLIGEIAEHKLLADVTAHSKGTASAMAVQSLTHIPGLNLGEIRPNA